MNKINKLLVKFNANPKDLTWNELVKILNSFGYFERKQKGKTGGSRRKFVNDKLDVIILHKPHPSPLVKSYIIRQLKEKLKLKS